MPEVVLIRHGETEWSRTGKHTGRTEIPLTARGERQARRIGYEFHSRRFGSVWCSPRRRAQDTARLAGLLDVRVEPDLAEWDYGAYEGQTTADISRRLGQPWSLWDDGVPVDAAHGERIQHVATRVHAVLARVRPTLLEGADVAHGHLLRLLAASWLSLPPQAGALFTLSAGSVSCLGFEHDRPALISWNHVPEPSDTPE